jgi:hypothetical protein
MPKITRKWRSWFGIVGALFVPWVSTMTGLTGFWPTMGVCSLAIAWSVFWWWPEISRLRIVPGSELNSTENAWPLILPGIAMLLLALLPFIRLYMQAREHVEPLGFEDLLQSYIHDRSVYITDLARMGPVIHDKTFEKVSFVGPAMITPIANVTMNGTIFDTDGGPPEATYLEVPDNTYTVGVIGLKDVIVKNCRFTRIQVVGDKAIIAKIKADVISSPPSQVPPRP